MSVETAILPDGWKDRLNYIKNENTGDATGCCIGIYDLVLSKYCAEREKDFEFISEIISMDMLDQKSLVDLAALLPLNCERIKRIQSFIERDFRFKQANEKVRVIERLELRIIDKVAGLDDGSLPLDLLKSRKSEFGLAGAIFEKGLDHHNIKDRLTQYMGAIESDINNLAKEWDELKQLNPNIKTKINMTEHSALNFYNMAKTSDIEVSQPDIEPQTSDKKIEDDDQP